MFSATDWMLKRVLKSVLKKTVGRYLQSEPDLDQLDVQLSKGTFELRNVLLNCDAVNAQLVRKVAGLVILHLCCMDVCIECLRTGTSFTRHTHACLSPDVAVTLQCRWHEPQQVDYPQSSKDCGPCITLQLML